MPKSKKGYIFLVKSDRAFLLDYSLNFSARFSSLKASTYLDLKFVDFYDLPKTFERDFFNRFQYAHLKNRWYSENVFSKALVYIEETVAALKLAKSVLTEPPPKPLIGMQRLVYILNHLDLKPLMQSAAILNRHSVELLPVVEFGSNPVHSAKLGFTLPITTSGPDKGKPDPIRYLSRLLDLYDFELDLVQQPKVNGVRQNNYSIRKRI